MIQGQLKSGLSGMQLAVDVDGAEHKIQLPNKVPVSVNGAPGSCADLRPGDGVSLHGLTVNRGVHADGREAAPFQGVVSRIVVTR